MVLGKQDEKQGQKDLRRAQDNDPATNPKNDDVILDILTLLHPYRKSTP